MPRISVLSPAIIAIFAFSPHIASANNAPILADANVIVPTPITPTARPISLAVKTAPLTMTPRKTAPVATVAPTQTAPVETARAEKPAAPKVTGPKTITSKFDSTKPTVAARAGETSGAEIVAPVVASKTTKRRAAPAQLASREAQARQLLLARLDADLVRAQTRLERSETRLTEGQKQLGSINNILKSTIADLGDDAKGLHPFVRVSQRYLGTPYVWGGESARGFDCSGFIMRVMRDLGYKALPHSAALQFNYGTPIARPLLKPGDIVFFANTYKRGVSHVGIYLGRGRFIHAANSKQGTIVSGLNEPKWVKHYAGARRLVHQ